MGQLIPRGPRKWLIREFVGSTTVNGKRKLKYASKIVNGNLAAAKDALAELTADVRGGSYIPPATQTLAEFVSWWLRDVVAQRVESATRRSYADRIAPVLKSVGHLRLDRVSTPVLQRCLNTLAGEGKWSRRTTRYTKTVLSMALAEAVRQGLLRANPCDSMILPRGTQKGDAGTQHGDDGAEPVSAAPAALRVWTQAQMQLFLERIKESEWYPVWALLLTTGLRPGEACGLRWEDFNGTDLNIQRAIKSDGAKGWVTGQPKTKGSRRTIPLPLSTIKVLRAHRSGQLTGHIFHRDAGHITPVQMHVAWARDVKRANMPHISLYGTRHTHATLLLSLGVPIKVVSERLGHSGVQITMDTYQHVLPHMQEDAANKLNAALGG